LRKEQPGHFDRDLVVSVLPAILPAPRLQGVAIGIAASMVITRLLSSMLFEVSATDPVTFAGVAVLLTLVALLASYIPARRAMRLDPNTALRYDWRCDSGARPSRPTTRFIQNFICLPSSGGWSNGRTSGRQSAEDFPERTRRRN
jgi:hypothetical protein